MSGPAISTRRKRVVSRGLHAGQPPTGHVWLLKLECGHEVWRLDSQHGATQKTADCWHCPATFRSRYGRRAAEEPARGT